jgi:DNA-binding winged helix-turn-helix (wHTH) protein
MAHSFGEFVFDPSARRLTLRGEPVHLTAKAFELLQLLASRRPDAVAKKEIQKLLWPDTFVSDVSLTTLVFELRAALGESARKPVFVRTVHGFGYAFQVDSWVDGSQTDTPFCIIHDGREIGLARGDNLIGRSRDCAVWLDSTRVSRHHARLTVDGDVVLIEDCGSRNGTFVGGQKAQGRVRLKDGDDIGIAGIHVLFRVLSTSVGTQATELD